MNIEECLKILELKRGASIDEIKTARLEMLQVWHPDKYVSNPKLAEKAKEKTLIINEAFKILVQEFKLKEQNQKSTENSVSNDYQKERERFSKKQIARFRYSDRKEKQTNRARRQLYFTLLWTVLTGLFGLVLGLKEWSFFLALLVMLSGLFISFWTYRKPIKKNKRRRQSL